jgi:hypothetical protein
MAFVKANILYRDRISLSNLEIEPCDDDELRVSVHDTTTWIQRLSHGLTCGRFNLKLHHPIHLRHPYFIQSDELENREPQEIVFTQFQGTEFNVAVHFRIKPSD